MTTIREIAKKSGYSPAAVSRLLNDDPTFSISDLARERILKVARNLNYYSQNVTKVSNYKIAIIFSVRPRKELEDTYFSNLRESIIAAGEKTDIQLLFFRKVSEITEKIDGFIAVGYFKQAELEILTHLSPNGVFVDSNPDPENFNSVQPNLESVTQRAINLFRQVNFDHIGFIGGKYWNSENQDIILDDPRKKYFESHMRELGIFDERFVFIGDSFSVESGYQLGCEIIASLAEQPLPQGFLIGSDPLAVGVLQAFNENKITVPIDTSIISINDLDIAKYISPPLTTFRIDVDQLGHLAINMLRDTIAFPDQNKRVLLLNANIIYRKSFIKP